MLIIVGYKGAIFLTNVYYGSGNGSVVLDNVQCILVLRVHWHNAVIILLDQVAVVITMISVLFALVKVSKCPCLCSS